MSIMIIKKEDEISYFKKLKYDNPEDPYLQFSFTQDCCPEVQKDEMDKYQFEIKRLSEWREIGFEINFGTLSDVPSYFEPENRNFNIVPDPNK